MQYDSTGELAVVLSGRLLYVFGGQQSATTRAPVARHAKLLSRACSALRWRPDSTRTEVVGVPAAVGQPLSLYGVASRTQHATARMEAPAAWGRCHDASFASTQLVASCFRDGKVRVWDMRSTQPAATIDL